jgi:hypothetical protein
LEKGIEDHRITSYNIYNVDEKGFHIGVGSSIKRIMSRKAYKAGQIRQAVHNGNREFISLIAYVSATSIAISPVLLYKSASGDLQDTWVKDVAKNQQAFFGGTENGWSSNVYGMQWLKTVFEPSTRPQNSRA